jgi:hypothetical protein
VTLLQCSGTAEAVVVTGDQEFLRRLKSGLAFLRPCESYMGPILIPGNVKGNLFVKPSRIPSVFPIMIRNLASPCSLVGLWMLREPLLCGCTYRTRMSTDSGVSALKYPVHSTRKSNHWETFSGKTIPIMAKNHASSSMLAFQSP